MKALIPSLTTAGIVLVAIVIAIVLIKSCWKVAGTNEVLIVSGMGKVKRKTGGGNNGNGQFFLESGNHDRSNHHRIHKHHRCTDSGIHDFET